MLTSARSVRTIMNIIGQLKQKAGKVLGTIGQSFMRNVKSIPLNRQKVVHHLVAREERFRGNCKVQVTRF